ncbi:hypothetical protein [Mycoplasma sp. OR1901]|uniref:hypothetical protein n=1 Tax=Mycoplasma sp. OR1901 TaxID=2742195 RepID=UPI0015820B43|nr:hypothetical protein [Mycoplasma sp. OR1901]QKT05164.1 hypothetical protein HTZ87_00315 [Mycoplasma sp. OR1901]
MYEVASQHNNDYQESAFIGNSYMFIHRFQKVNENISEYISYRSSKVDQLSENKLTKANLDNAYYPNIDYRLKSADPLTFAKRLTKEDETNGIKNVRSRSFAIDSYNGGSWSVIGRSNKKDYRFYVLTNSHVTAPIIVGETNNFIKNLFESPWAKEPKVDSILVPTLIGKNDMESNNKKPYYEFNKIYGVDDKNNVNRLWFTNLKFSSNDYISANNIENLYLFNKNKEEARSINEVIGRIKIPLEDQISFKVIKDFRIKDEKVNGKSINENLRYLHGKQLDNEGNSLLERDKNNNMDLSIAEIDFSFFFKNFKDQKGQQNYTFNGYTLKNSEKAVVDFILNLEDLKPLKISDEVYHYNDYSSLNWYVGSFPIEKSTNKDALNYIRRYREYLITNISELTSYRAPITFGNYFARIFNINQKAVDLSGGSSGTSVFDSSGNLVGIINSGSGVVSDPENGYIAFLVFDDQKISFFGDTRNLNNPNSFISETKKLAYLYPGFYDDIYKEEN